MKPFDDIVYAIYDAALSPDRWPAALSAIGRLFDAEGAVILFYDGARGAEFIFSPEMQAAVEVYVAEEWWTRDIHAQRALESHLTSGDVFSDFTLATPKETETLPIYVDFFARVGFGWLMSSVMLPNIDKLVALSVPRARRKGPFRDEEMETLRVIGRHAEQALRISLRIANLEGAQIMLLAALDTVEAGIYALDGDERLLHANKAGRAQFTDHFAVLDGRIAPRSKACRPRFAAMLAAARAPRLDGAPPRSCVLSGEDGRRIALWALPITDAGRSRIDLDGEARSLLVALPLERGHRIDPTVLRDVFALSIGEARLAALIGGGIPLCEAADRLGVTEGTARIVLKRVFRKLGVNRQAELVLQLSALAGFDLAGPGPLNGRTGAPASPPGQAGSPT